VFIKGKETYMKVKSKIGKGIFMGVAAMGVITFAILFLVYWNEILFGRVRVFGAKMDYVEEYQDYYYRAEIKVIRFIATSVVKDVYFKPGQRKKMYKKIREDATNELEQLIVEYGDIFYKYEISDDFRQICIYETPGGIGRRGFFDLRPGVINRIESLIGLYHNIKEGRSVTMHDDYEIEIIKPND
jgi:hypothetical protein